MTVGVGDGAGHFCEKVGIIEDFFGEGNVDENDVGIVFDASCGGGFL